MVSVAQANAESASAGPGCPMQVRIFAPDAGFDDPGDLQSQTVHLFAALGRDDFARAMQGMEPGDARDVSERFTGSDSRWRLLRPLDIPDDPDAFVIFPTQVQYLIRMPQDSPIESLVLVGLPENGNVARPAVAGRLGVAAGKDAGQLFTIEPANEADRCPVVPAGAADWAARLIRAELQHERARDPGKRGLSR